MRFRSWASLGWAISSVVAIPASWGQSASVSEYGELFFVEHLEETSPVVTMHLGPGWVFSNPYYEMFFLNGTLQAHLSKYVRVGLDGYVYRSQAFEVTRSIEEQLRGVGVRQVIDEKQHAAFGVISLIPFSGHLALFNWRAVPLSLAFTAGLGGARYRQRGWVLEGEWRVELGIQMSRRLGGRLQFGQWLSSISTDTFGALGLEVRL